MLPDEYADAFLADIAILEALDPRGQAALDGHIGASSFDCRERLRRTIGKVPRTDAPPKWAAHVGSAIDVWVKNMRKANNPHLITDAEYRCVLPSGFELIVHPDEVDPTEPSVTDLKSKAGLAAVRGGFTEDSNRFQRHLQYYAAWQNGVVPEVGIVRNVFVDRSGKDSTVHVEQEPFSIAVVVEATDFLKDALYALEHGEEAAKDKPRYFCKVACEWYTACRGGDLVTDLIADLPTAQRVDAYHAASQRAKDAKELMDALRADGLEGLSGCTDRTRLTSTFINASNRTPYWRLETEAIGS